MEKITTTKRLTIVKQYLSGLSYDEIAAKSGVSKGAVANIITELKAGKFPEAADAAEHIEQLRELSRELKRLKLSPGQCATGFILLTRINECGLDPADIDRWPLILKSVGNEEEAQEFVRLVYSIQEVQKRTGLTLNALDDKARELERKAADLEPMSRQREDCRKQVAELTKQRGELASAAANLEEKYKLLNPRVKDLEKREQDLSRRIVDMEPRAQKAETTLTALNKDIQRLQDTGLPFEELAEFSQRVQVVAQHHNIKPAELSGRLLRELETLDKGLGLEALIQSRQQELDKKEQAVDATKQESETIKAVVSSLKQEKTSLEASIKETREKVNREIAKITPAAQDTIDRLVKELRRGHDEALAEVHRLKDEALEVGKEVGRYEGILQVNEWLNELLALVRGEESLEGKRVRVIVLLVLRGAAAWLKHNKGENLVFSPLLSTAESLIRELEQWKV
jgi:predicted  nucleic acid-binding Zn-ribbon protein